MNTYDIPIPNVIRINYSQIPVLSEKRSATGQQWQTRNKTLVDAPPRTDQNQANPITNASKGHFCPFRGLRALIPSGWR